MKKIVMMLGMLVAVQAVANTNDWRNVNFYFAQGLQPGFINKTEWNDGVNDFTAAQRDANNYFKKKDYQEAGKYYGKSGNAYWDAVKRGENCGQANHALEQWARAAHSYMLAGDKKKAIEALVICQIIAREMNSNESYRSNNRSCGFLHNTLKGVSPYYGYDNWGKYYNFYTNKLKEVQKM